jgi:hypothetical protein
MAGQPATVPAAAAGPRFPVARRLAAGRRRSPPWWAHVLAVFTLNSAFVAMITG